MPEDLGESFVQEFVVGLGLLGGMGVDPEGMILQALNDILKSMNPSMDFGLLITIFSIIVTVLSLLGAFILGGWAGIIAVGLAFVGGIFIHSQFGVWLVVIAVILGFFAPQIKHSLGE